MAAAAHGVGVQAAQALPPIIVLVVDGGNQDMCVALRSAALCPGLVLTPVDPTNRAQLWRRKMVLPGNTFELINMASGTVLTHLHVVPRQLLRTAYYHPNFMFAPARFEEVAPMNAAAGVFGGGGGVQIDCVSAHQLHLPALRYIEWPVGGGIAAHEGMLVVDEGHGEEDEDAMVAELEELTRTPTPRSTGLCARMTRRIRSLFGSCI